MTDRYRDNEARFEEAVEYAVELLDGFDETGEPPPVAAVLDHLADEYDAALRERRGMDPRLVRWAVQSLIDVAQFPPGNRPDDHDPDDPESASNPDAPLFHFLRTRGRPPDSKGAAIIAYTLGAIVEHFGFTIYRNDEPSHKRQHERGISAIDAVVEAQKRRNGQPGSYSGVRNCLERDCSTRDAFDEGRLAGAASRASPAKQLPE